MILDHCVCPISGTSCSASLVSQSVISAGMGHTSPGASFVFENVRPDSSAYHEAGIMMARIAVGDIEEYVSNPRRHQRGPTALRPRPNLSRRNDARRLRPRLLGRAGIDRTKNPLRRDPRWLRTSNAPRRNSLRGCSFGPGGVETSSGKGVRKEAGRHQLRRRRICSRCSQASEYRPIPARG